MKIGMVVSYLDEEVGSHEFFLGNELSRLEHEVILFTSTKPRPGTKVKSRIGELAEPIASKISPSAEIQYTRESWDGDIKKLIPDNSKIKRELGFARETSLEEGINQLIDWFNKTESNNIY